MSSRTTADEYAAVCRAVLRRDPPVWEPAELEVVLDFLTGRADVRAVPEEELAHLGPPGSAFREAALGTLEWVEVTGSGEGDWSRLIVPARPDPVEGPGPARPVGARTQLAGAGRFELIERIGTGGLGQVWRAEQTVPVTRPVAVKLIRAGLSSAAVLARFEAERQVLARMDHPNIAKVYDAGATPGGQPYFVMELVAGVRITQYCDDNRLTLRVRLGLFVPVCRAIQHAHLKGVIHRDVKPSNVLVTRHDEAPVPKVIDFGVARARRGAV